ncbi:MAG TPA: hypothetical protein VGW37_11600 [Terriglobia bacterium]|nr:hypothetical protein [Terriglobia bacterium]
METELKQGLIAHFRPLISEFVSEIEGAGLDVKPGSPQPFFPVFGEAYERSSLRMVIVGQDTRGWGCLKRFMEMERAAPGSALADDLTEFRDLDFKNWGATRYTFWGFAMMFLAALHGRSDWGVMKRGAYPEILSSFAWGNGNAVEYYNSSPKTMAWDQWELVRKAGERFNGLRHLVETIGPRVVVVLWKDMNPAAYFAGYGFTQVEEAGGIRHFRVPAANVDVFQATHPVRMRWEGVAADDVCAQLVARLQVNNLSVAFPAFVQHSSDSENAIAHLRKSAPARKNGFDKFRFVEWVAEELKKRGSFMSAPTLARLLNELGFETDYGCEYTGGRGTYNLISGTYWRLERDGRGERAGMVAEAFRKPNFEYAYEV